MIWFCLPVSTPGQPEDAGRQLKKKKRKKSRKQPEKANAPSVKQAASNTDKPPPGQNSAPQASKSSPQGTTRSRNESLVTGKNSSVAIIWSKLPELRSLCFSCITHIDFGKPFRSSAELKTSLLIPHALRACVYGCKFVMSPLGGSLDQEHLV